MQINVTWSPRVSAKFPQLSICIGLINGVAPEKENDRLRRLKKIVQDEVRSKYDIETLKDDRTVRAYRDFYWKLDIDPTKTRPAGEALLRRVLHFEELPNISTVVDAYNLGSMKTIVPMSGFDRDRLTPPFEIRFAIQGEIFVGIGVKVQIPLTAKMLVLTDQKRVLGIYPYRDCDHTKITTETRNVVIVGCGAPGITERQLEEAVETTLSFIKQVSEGEIQTVEVFQNSFA